MSTYSKNAMPQLARMTSHSGAALCFKCPYHANVIKTFENTSSKTGSQRVWSNAFMAADNKFSGDSVKWVCANPFVTWRLCLRPFTPLRQIRGWRIFNGMSYDDFV